MAFIEIVKKTNIDFIGLRKKAFTWKFPVTGVVPVMTGGAACAGVRGKGSNRRFSAVKGNSFAWPASDP